VVVGWSPLQKYECPLGTFNMFKEGIDNIYFGNHHQAVKITLW
jgi:hypothetical protein